MSTEETKTEPKKDVRLSEMLFEATKERRLKAMEEEATATEAGKVVPQAKLNQMDLGDKIVHITETHTRATVNATVAAVKAFTGEYSATVKRENERKEAFRKATVRDMLETLEKSLIENREKMPENLKKKLAELRSEDAVTPVEPSVKQTTRKEKTPDNGNNRIANIELDEATA